MRCIKTGVSVKRLGAWFAGDMYQIAPDVFMVRANLFGSLTPHRPCLIDAESSECQLDPDRDINIITFSSDQVTINLDLRAHFDKWEPQLTSKFTVSDLGENHGR